MVAGQTPDIKRDSTAKLVEEARINVSQSARSGRNSSLDVIDLVLTVRRIF